MRATTAASPRGLRARLLGGDEPVALLRILALVLTFWILGVLTLTELAAVMVAQMDGIEIDEDPGPAA